jgi:hypothetical protein
VSTPDPVSWRLVEPGWSVLDADGNEIGRVDQVTGDLNADIFDGITIGAGGVDDAGARYVPAENVAQILVGVIHLDLSAADAAKLAPYAENVVEPLEALEPAAAAERKSKLNWAQRLWLTTLGRKP